MKQRQSRQSESRNLGKCFPTDGTGAVALTVGIFASNEKSSEILAIHDDDM